MEGFQERQTGDYHYREVLDATDARLQIEHVREFLAAARDHLEHTDADA